MNQMTSQQYSNYSNAQQQQQQQMIYSHMSIAQQQQQQQHNYIIQQQQQHQLQHQHQQIQSQNDAALISQKIKSTDNVNQFINNTYQSQQQPHQQIMIASRAQPIVNNDSSRLKSQQATNLDLTSNISMHLALLGLAESFQQSNQFRLCIHCLESILTLKLQDLPIIANFHMQLKTRLNLCRLYLKHTQNTNQYINAHLEKSIILVQNLNINDEYKYEATYKIYKIFQKQKELHIQLKQSQNQVDKSQLATLFNSDLIRNTLESSSVYPIWHMRLLFLIGNILLEEKDFAGAAFYMSIGIDFCASNRIAYTHILFILSKGLIHLLQRNSNDLQVTMQPCANLIESYHTSNIYQIESLKVFFLVLQVTYFLQCGQMKSVRNTLKSLQHYIQSLSARNDTDNEHANLLSQNSLENFYWMHKDHLAILVYLLTVVHSTQTGCFDKAHKFTDKALLSIQKLKLKEQTLCLQDSASFLYGSSIYITNKFNFLFLENQIRSNIAMGQRQQALKQLGDAFSICDKDFRLMFHHAPQLHCLVGIYSLSINNREAAISHFNQSIQSTTDKDLWIYCVMNLALCYLGTVATSPDSKTKLLTILDNVMPEKIQTQNTALTSFSHYFKALIFAISNNYPKALESLREAVLLSNSEELSNITANSFLFMGHISFIMNQFQESFNMLTNGVELADKMSDMNLKTYGSRLFKDLYKYFNDPREAETSKKSAELEQANSLDYFEAVKMPHHALINWNTNCSPTQILSAIQQQQRSILSASIPSNKILNTNQMTSPSQQPMSQPQQTVIISNYQQSQHQQATLSSPKQQQQHHQSAPKKSSQNQTNNFSMNSGQQIITDHSQHIQMAANIATHQYYPQQINIQSNQIQNVHHGQYPQQIQQLNQQPQQQNQHSFGHASQIVNQDQLRYQQQMFIQQQQQQQQLQQKKQF